MTLIELIIAALVASIFMIFVGSFLISSFRNSIEMQSFAELGEMSSQSVLRLKSELAQSKRMFGQDASGLAYWEVLEFPDRDKPVGDSQLPEIIDAGSLTPSKIEDFKRPFVRNAVGNALLFAETQPAFRSEKAGRLIDMVRFKSVTLVRRSDASLSPGIPFYLDLMHCQSGLYADRQQIMDLDNEDVRNRVLDDFRVTGVAGLWDSQAEAAEAFYNLDLLLEERPLIRMKSCVPAVPGLGRLTRGIGRTLYSVAVNQTKEFSMQRPVPLFAAPRGGEVGFPNGFEVAAVGPKSGRQVLLRLVLVTPLATQNLSREATAIAVVKDI